MLAILYIQKSFWQLINEITSIMQLTLDKAKNISEKSSPNKKNIMSFTPLLGTYTSRKNIFLIVLVNMLELYHQ